MGADSFAIMRERSLSFRVFKTAAGWAALAFALVTVFVLVLFPYDLLQTRLLAIAGTAAGIELQADNWAWMWPVGFRWNHVTVGPPSALEATSLEVRPSGLTLIQGQPGMHVVSSLRTAENPSAGLVEFRLRLDGWSAHAAGRITGILDRLDVRVFDPTLVKQGRLRVTFDHAWTGPGHAGQFLGGEGTWDILLSDLSMDRLVLGPFTSSPAVISVVTARLTCKAATCDVRDFRGESPDGIATGSGRLTLRQPLRDSVVDLTIDLVPSLSMAQKAGHPLVQAGAPIRFTVNGRVSGLTVKL